MSLLPTHASRLHAEESNPYRSPEAVDSGPLTSRWRVHGTKARRRRAAIGYWMVAAAGGLGIVGTPLLGFFLSAINDYVFASGDSTGVQAWLDRSPSAMSLFFVGWIVLITLTNFVGILLHITALPQRLSWMNRRRNRPWNLALMPWPFRRRRLADRRRPGH